MSFKLVYSRCIVNSGAMLIALSSGFSEAGPTGAMICADQFVEPYDGQYLVLESDYFQTMQNLPPDSADDPVVAHVLDIDSPLAHRFSEQQLTAPYYCWAVNIQKLAVHFPALEKSILEYQLMPAADRPQGYRIIALSSAAHNDGLRARAQPALIAAFIAYALFTWTLPGWATLSALVVGGICFSRPEFCHYLFASAQTTVSGLFANTDTQQPRPFPGQGITLGTKNQGASSTTVLKDGDNRDSDFRQAAAAERFKAFSGKGHPLAK